MQRLPAGSRRTVPTGTLTMRWRALLPRLMIPVMVRACRHHPATPSANSLTQAQRRRAAGGAQALSDPHRRSRGPVEEAIITAGGVKVSEVDPHTMASKAACRASILPGKLLDVDAYTGGFNLADRLGHRPGRAGAGMLPSSV